MRTKLILGLVGLALLIGGGLVFLISADYGTNAGAVTAVPVGVSSTPTPIINATQTPARGTPLSRLTWPPTPVGQKPIYGMPAIQPHLTPANSSGPTFNEQDVRDYLATHPVYNIKEKAVSSPTIDKVEFLTYANLKIRDSSFSAFSGLPEDYPFCRVELKGQFEKAAPPINATPHILTSSLHVVVFDATTGNLVQI